MSNGVPIILIISPNEDEIAEISEFMAGMPNVTMGNIVVARTLAEAREVFLENYSTLRVIMPSADIPADGEDDIFYFTGQIADSDWMVRQVTLLVACSKNERLYFAGCQTHYGHDEYQSLVYVLRQHLSRLAQS